MPSRLKTLLLIPFLSLAPRVSAQTVEILFTAQLHGYLFSDQPGTQGDLLRIQKSAGRIIEENQLTRDRFLLFDTGNALSYHYLNKADSARTFFEVMSQTGFDALALGNYDFRFGRRNLTRLSESFDSPKLLSTNIVQADDSEFMEPWVILKRNGVKFGILAAADQEMADVVAAENWKGLQVRPAQDFLKPLVEELSAKCDVVLVLSRLSDHETLELARSVPGIDVIISAPGQTEQSGILKILDSKNRLKTVLVTAATNAVQIGHLRLSVSSAGAGYRLADCELLEPERADAVAESEIDLAPVDRLEELYSQYSLKKYGLQPDVPLVNLAAGFSLSNLTDYVLYLLLKSSHSEIAFLSNDFFKPILPNDENQLTLRDIDRIVWRDETVVIMRQKGKNITSMLKRSDSEFQPDHPAYLNVLSVRNFGSAKQGRYKIHGKPIPDTEIFSVVTSKVLASGGLGYSDMKLGTHRKSRFTGETRIVSGANGHEVSISELLIRYLLLEKPDFGQLDQWLARSDYLNRALWRLDIEKLDFGFSTVSVHNNEAFENVKDSRVNAATEDLVTLLGSGDVNLVRQTSAFRWKNGVLVRYARSRIGDDEFKETDDNLELESTLDIYALAFGNGRLNPYLGLRYDTELSPTRDEAGVENPYQKDFYSTLGLSFFGTRLTESRIGFFGKYDLEEKKLNSGLELNARYLIGSGWLSYESAFRLRYILSNADPGASDELYSLDLANTFRITLTENLELRPRVDLFVFHGKVVKDTATNLRFSVNLSYTKIWKFQYLRFFRNKEDS